MQLGSKNRWIYLRKKDASKDRTGMRRHLKIPDLILAVLEPWVGTGIFTIWKKLLEQPNMPGQLSDRFDCHFSPLCEYFGPHAELPRSSGQWLEPTVIFAVLGEFPAWLVAGWLTIIRFMTAISGVTSGWGMYLKVAERLGIQRSLNGTANPCCSTYVDLLPILVLFVTGVVLLNSKAALLQPGGLENSQYGHSLSLRDFLHQARKLV